jgi:hypothetical protein
MIEDVIADDAEVADVSTEASGLAELSVLELGMVGGGIAAVAFV